jgi:hypothetical protein
MNVMLVSWAPLYSFGLFIGMLLCGALGRYLAIRRDLRNAESIQASSGVLEGAVFGLLGLVVAFSFSGAVSRFDERRQLAVEEANAIGTAYLRLDLMPAQAQPAMRENMRQYLESRIRFYQALPDIGPAEHELQVAQKLQSALWTQAIEGSNDSQPARMLVLPAFNEMFDIVTSRTMALFMHPPHIVFGMLFGLALIAAVIAGDSMAKARTSEWLRMGAFAAVMSITFYVIVDIEFPRAGLIRSTAFDQALSNLRDSMK